VPAGFVGVNLDGPPLTPGDNVPLEPQFRLMTRSRVESVRVRFSWASAQPYASWSEVPANQAGQFVSGAGGIPTSFAATDQIVQLAATHGMSVLPIVIYVPSWDAAPGAGSGLARPRDDRPYGQYVTTLIGRYGPHGSFWNQHPGIPKRPIRMWEIWNEPDIVGNWPTQPFAHSYVALLRVAHAAVKRADPHALVVLAGVPDFSWQLLDSIYRVRGARRLFDVVDVHPYTKRPAGVIEILRHVRAVLKRHRNPGRPIIAGETGWPSSLGQTPRIFDFETTEAGQARRLAALLPLLAANRRRLGLLGFYWYTWMGDEYSGAFPFNFSGLLAFRNGNVSAKPGLSAFRTAALALER
jgi:hypothetical protein